MANISSDSCVWNEKVKARSLTDAKDKFMNKAVNDWDIDVPTDWQDFERILLEQNVIVGSITDIEEL